MRRARRLLAAVCHLALCWPGCGWPSAAGLDTCADLERQASNGKYLKRMTQNVTLVCDAAPACAAFALLRAVMLTVGFSAKRVHVQRYAPAASLCGLYKNPPELTGRVVMVALASVWAGEPCLMKSGSLSMMATSPLKLDLRLHARAPAAAAACRRAILCYFYEDTAVLTECGFLSRQNESAVVYVLRDEWQRWQNTDGELKRRLTANRTHSRTTISQISRVELAAHLRNNTNHSFLFVDTPLWGDSQQVITCDPLDVSLSVRVVNHHATRDVPSLYYKTLGDFNPRASDLLELLTRAESFNVEEAACERAWKVSEFETWRELLSSPYLHSVVVIFCETKTKNKVENWSSKVFANMTQDLARYIFNNLTKNIQIGIDISIKPIDCFSSKLYYLIGDMTRQYYEGSLTRTVGIVGPAEVTAVLARYPGDVRPPLIAYDVPAEDAPGVRAASGRREHLVIALRQLLAACEWRRAVVVSERSRLAAVLAAALRDPATGLALREWTASNKTEIEHALKDSVKDDARVFIVNAGAIVAAEVLAEAMRQNLTREKGYVWILREYDSPDDATAVLRPYSVSFQWRGEARPGEARADEPQASALRKRLDALTDGRTWPRYASATADALLTLAEGFIRLIKDHPEMRDHPDNNKERYFWESVQSNNITGVIEEIQYGEHGVLAPLVFVEQWGKETRPLRLASWRSGEWQAAGEMCFGEPAPLDGSVRCLIPTGDAFRPICRDMVWAFAAALAVVAVVALVFAVRGARRALQRRYHRIRIEERQQMLERRQHGLAALAPHYVDRAALELRDELGAGQFGRVRLGVLRRPGCERPILVAAKALRDDAAPSEETAFLREACTIAGLEHEHVVRFVGVCVVGGPPLLLMEHAFFGDLLSYLRARRHLAEGAAEGAGGAGGVGREEAAYVSAAALTRLAHEAASALAYVARRGLVHRDVRAANCLVDGRRSLKLADFGLARATGTVDGEYACRGRALFPVLRMAPESLARGVSSAASDVWAFGVLVLELVTLGARPYGSASPPSVMRSVLEGGRPPLPRDACSETRALTGACWQRAPEARPAAARLAAWLAAHRRALRPALAAELDEVDGDSGFDETPRADFDEPDTSPGSPVI